MNNILDLPDVLLKHVLDFVKIDSYAIIGPVCKQFRSHYKPSDRVTRTSKYTQSPQLFSLLQIQFTSSSLLDDLILRDEIDIIPLLLERGYEWDHFCVESAAETNNYNFFEWLRTTELPWLADNAHFSAAWAGNLEMMIYLVQSGAGFPDERSLIVAQKHGFNKIVGWLQELALDSAYTMVQAAREDDVYAFEQVEFFDDHILNRMYVKEACINGSVNVLEFFRERVEHIPTASDFAAALHFQRSYVLDWFASQLF